LFFLKSSDSGNVIVKSYYCQEGTLLRKQEKWGQEKWEEEKWGQAPFLYETGHSRKWGLLSRKWGLAPFFLSPFFIGEHPLIYYTLFINELKGGTLGNVPINY
jgi:hypothetical protein